MEAEKEFYPMLENLLFPKIFRSFRIAIQPTKLIIALCAIGVICLAGWLMDLSGPVVTSEAGFTELEAYMQNPDTIATFIEVNKEIGGRVGLFSTLWHFGSDKFHLALRSLFSFNLPDMAWHIGSCFKAVGWAIRYHYVYSIIFFLIKLTALSVAGGAICRIAALQFARDEKPGLREALRYGFRKFLSFFTAPLLPLAMIIFIGIFVFLLGLVANIPRVGELIMMVFMPLALLAGALVAVILIGTVAGVNLMFPAVAYDGSDCFDALSRAFSYVYSRPWRMGLYSGLAVAYGAVCYVFVRFFAFLAMLGAYVLLDLGIFVNGDGGSKLARIWEKPTFVRLVPPGLETAANWTEGFSAAITYVMLLAVIGLVVSFVISFYFSANTVIYALMRNKVDNTSLEEVYSQPEEGEPEAAVEPGAGEAEAAESPEPRASDSQTSDSEKEQQ